MTTILAAVDASPAGPSVVGAALGMAELTGSTVEVVHVADGDAGPPAIVAAAAGVPLRVVAGPVEPALLAAVEAPEVVAAVVGGRRGARGTHPVGHVALHLLQRTDKPVTVVPPRASLRPLRRLLVPLEGAQSSSRAIAERLARLVHEDVDLVVLHVFTHSTAPRMLDRPQRDLALLGTEFLAHHLPAARDIRLRTGSVAFAVTEVCEREPLDLVVLSWSQDASAGRAEVVREVLLRSPVPVLLLPLRGPGPG